MKDPCFICEMQNFSLEKRRDRDFIEERKEEFFPSESYGSLVNICDECAMDVFWHYQKEFAEFLAQKMIKNSLND